MRSDSFEDDDGEDGLNGSPTPVDWGMVPIGAVGAIRGGSKGGGDSGSKRGGGISI